jgi:flavin reductase (DIM6/NTAB) family NADH-FMN oxidoreductase RutF
MSVPQISAQENISTQRFRDLMSIVCGPVVVITTTEEQKPAGTTVSAFSSLSLQPRLVMLALDRTSRLLARLRRTRRFGVNILDAGQSELATLFATKREDKFSGVPWSQRSGLPYLHGSPGWAECEVESLLPGGDHVIVVGRVEELEYQACSPLIYAGRTFGTHLQLDVT